MTSIQIGYAVLGFLLVTAVAYGHSGWLKIRDCYSMWFTREYWTNYNIVEALSWAAKAVIIVPGLIFGIQIWWLYFLALFTSLTLIWASNKKLLPSLVAFNTIWVFISCMVLAQHLVK
jgi:hypothetical protein